MLSVTVGKGRRKRTLEFSNLNRMQLHSMTERTQQQMFGEIVHRRPSDRSIHPFGRRRVSALQWAKMQKENAA
jgi:hypothetical protein